MTGSGLPSRRTMPPHERGSVADDRQSARRFDVVVVGGGINGAAIARAAAQAGYSVLLVEQNDFGWGTTWRSTKLIHGGLRYLEHAELGLVFESLRDQAMLLRQYPDMVRPLRLLLPVFAHDRHRPAIIGLGLYLYDLLSIGRSLPAHRRLNRAEALSLEPGLQARGLSAAFVYSDCQLAYPERLCLQTVLEAEAAGAVARNHTDAVGLLLKGNGRVGGVRIRDEATGTTSEVAAGIVVNAAGPWVDEVLAKMPRPPDRQIGGTKGVHLVVDYAGHGPLHALYSEARSDHRPFFIVPWRDKHLVGTTDTRFLGPPAKARAGERDVQYLLDEANARFDGHQLSVDDVLYAYAGVRPLPASSGKAEGSITRRHIIRDHASEGHPGLVSIIGGKLSTYPSLADQTVARLRRLLPASAERHVALGRQDAAPAGRGKGSASLRGVPRAMAAALLDYLRSTYGPRLQALIDLIDDNGQLLEPLCPHGPDVEAQVLFACRTEHASTLADVLLRRTGAGWNRCLALDCAERTAALMASELDWSAAEQADQVKCYNAEVDTTFYRPARSGPAGSARLDTVSAAG